MMLMPNKGSTVCAYACDASPTCSTEVFATPDTRAAFAYNKCEPAGLGGHVTPRLCTSALPAAGATCTTRHCSTPWCSVAGRARHLWCRQAQRPHASAQCWPSPLLQATPPTHPCWGCGKPRHAPVMATAPGALPVRCQWRGRNMRARQAWPLDIGFEKPSCEARPPYSCACPRPPGASPCPHPAGITSSAWPQAAA